MAYAKSFSVHRLTNRCGDDTDLLRIIASTVPDPVNVTLAIPVVDNLRQKIESVDPRLNVVSLSRAQRHVYREGRPLWPGYYDPPAGSRPDEESEKEATKALAATLAVTQVVFTNPIIPSDIADRSPNLRWLQLTSAGVDRLLDSPLVRSGVTVTTASGIHAVTISEYVLGAMLAFAKGFTRAVRSQQESQWSPYGPQELEGQTVGIVGMGAIGSRVAELSHAFGMRVLAIRRSVDQRTPGEGPVDELLPTSDLPYLLGESDYVVLAMPLTPESTKLIGEAELRSMKQSAVLVNIARGAVIDEPVLIRAMKEHWIAGAALDVFEKEPLPSDSELWGLENVLLTPHISGGTPKYMERAVGLFCENLRRYLAGETLRNVVDPARGY
jgi:phosphoglycerate dehydrogenase-like enzyme